MNINTKSPQIIKSSIDKYSDIDNFIKKPETRVSIVSKLIDRVNKEISPADLSLKFKYDDDINFLYIEIVNFKTKKIISQIPEENFLKLKRVILGLIQNYLDELIKKNSKVADISIEISDSIVLEDKSEEVNLLNEMKFDLNLNKEVNFDYKENRVVITDGEIEYSVGELKDEESNNFNYQLKEVIGIIGMIFDNKI